MLPTRGVEIVKPDLEISNFVAVVLWGRSVDTGGYGWRSNLGVSRNIWAIIFAAEPQCDKTAVGNKLPISGLTLFSVSICALFVAELFRPAQL